MYRRETSLEPEMARELTDAELAAVCGGQGGLGDLGNVTGGGSPGGTTGLGNSVGGLGGLGGGLKMLGYLSQLFQGAGA
jgi:hypothetical protein